MKHKILFIGPNFGELLLKEDILKRDIINRLWLKCNEVNSVFTFNLFIEDLKRIRKKEPYYSENRQFLLLIEKLSEEFNYVSIKDSNERLVTFKKLLSQTLETQIQAIETNMQDILGKYLSKHAYIFSYQMDDLVETLLRLKNKVTICENRQALLLNEVTLDSPTLYKLYGSIEHFESLVVTTEEKKDYIINLRMAISKIATLQDFTVSFIGFNEDNAELNDVLKEIAEKEIVECAELYRQGKHTIEKYNYINKKNNLRLEVIVADLETYLIEKTGYLEKIEPLKERTKIEKSSRKRKNWYTFGKKKKKEKKEREKKVPHKTMIVAITLLVVFFSFNFFFSVATISGESMAPSLNTSDYILLNKQYSQVKRFDVIAFDSPDEREREYIKRVIGVPGDEIEYRDDQLYINGNLIKETYLDREKKNRDKKDSFTKDFTLESLTGVKVVPKNKLFVLGDNRLYSRDSRDFGFIDIKDIRGDVKVKLWPIKF